MLRAESEARIGEPFDVLVGRNDLRQIEVTPSKIAVPEPGEALLRIERYSLTANTISYAASGDVFGYWKFFPTRDGWGRLPVWGYAKVVESAHPELRIGERLFGYFPMSSHMTIKVANPTSASVTDATEHRQELPAVYNIYHRVMEEDQEFMDRNALVGPIFLLPFVLNDELQRRDDYGAAAIIVLSASSKTAIGLAHLLAGRNSSRVIGVTAAANVDFVQSLGLYNRVVSYDDVASLAALESAISIDLSGNLTILRRVHAALGHRLRQSMIAGLTHWDGEPWSGAPARGILPGPDVWVFFAPDYIRDRVSEWGQTVFQAKADEATKEYVLSTKKWLNVLHSDGPEAAVDAFRRLVDGKIPPSEGLIVRP